MTWIKYLSRPNTLFSASLWVGCYKSSYWKDTFAMDDALAYMIEDKNHVVHWFWDKKQLDLYNKNKIKHFKITADNSSFLREAEKLNRESLEKEFDTFGEAVDYFNRLFFFGTIYPFTFIQTEERLNRKDYLHDAFEKLRKVSLYPQFIEMKLVPFVSANPRYPYITATDHIIEKKGRFFIYRNEKKEVVEWSDDTTALLQKLMGITEDLKGMCAQPGRVRGKVRIVNKTADCSKVKEGDIVVTVTSNPTLMPALRKAGAIIADEGGMTCHASVISRELGIPCVVGVKHATLTLKEGDEIEVDAGKGTVKVIR